MKNIMLELAEQMLTQLHLEQGITYSQMRTVYEDLLLCEMSDMNYMPKTDVENAVLCTITRLRQIQVANEIIYFTIRRLITKTREDQPLERKVN